MTSRIQIELTGVKYIERLDLKIVEQNLPIAINN